MNRFKIAAVGFSIGLAVLAGSAGATCFKCVSGHCVPAGSGEPGWMVCSDNDPCDVQEGSQCTGTTAGLGEQPVAVGVNVYRLPTGAAAHSGTDRLRSGAPIQAELARVAANYADGPVLVRSLLAYTDGKSRVLATTSSGVGFAIVPVRRDHELAVCVSAISASQSLKVATLNLTPSTIGALPVEVAGRQYLLVMRAEPLYGGPAGPAEQMLRVREAFLGAQELYPTVHDLSVVVSEDATSR